MVVEEREPIVVRTGSGGAPQLCMALRKQEGLSFRLAHAYATAAFNKAVVA